jgi:BirA family biotin operon repressor/biotin-[acetyl-CoA-carboxylase] ligase
MHSIYLSEIDSTQTYITDLLPNQHPHKPIAAFTFNQFKGKGQLNKTWISEPNAGIALSIAFPFPKSTEIDWVEINKQLCSGIITFLREHFQTDFYLKWPNDIIVNDRKFGGMIMNVVAKDEVQYLVLGLGLNLIQPPELPQAIGLHEILNQNDFDPKPLTQTLIAYLNILMGEKPNSKVAQTYSEFLWRIGEMVAVQPYNQNQEKMEQPAIKKFIGVDESGRALFYNQEGLSVIHSGIASILLPLREK